MLSCQSVSVSQAASHDRPESYQVYNLSNKREKCQPDDIAQSPETTHNMKSNILSPLNSGTQIVEST